MGLHAVFLLIGIVLVALFDGVSSRGRTRRSRTVTIGLSGFGPYRNISDNPSRRVVERIEHEGLEDFVPNARLVVAIMEVTYAEVEEFVNELWDTVQPDLVVHLGAHPFPGIVAIEQQSFAEGYIKVDVKGRVPRWQRVPQKTAKILKSGLNAAELARKVTEKMLDTPIRILASYDPERYLCGYCYYLSLNRDQKRSLFVHVPDFEGSVTEEVVTTAVKYIIQESVKQLRADGYI